MPMLIGLAAGTPLLGIGLYQVFTRNLNIVGIAVWMVGGVAVHDLVLVPVVFAAGALLRRLARDRWLAPLQAALVASGILVLFAVPALSGKGVSAADPSRLPGDYPRAVAGLLLGIWIAAGIWALSAGRRRGT